MKNETTIRREQVIQGRGREIRRAFADIGLHLETAR